MQSLFDAHSHLSGALPTPEADCLQVICGTSEAGWQAVLAHAEAIPSTLPMLGLHPWHIAMASPGWELRLEALLRPHRAGVGECGLDFARKDADLPTQEGAFRAHLRLAHTLHRPVAVHAVRAWGRMLDLLREEGVPSAGAMVHAYSGSPDTARVLQSMGIFLSFSGNLLNPARTKLREALQAVDARHLLVETDGTSNLTEVIAAAAELRGVPAQALADQTWENGRRCFKELLA